MAPFVTTTDDSTEGLADLHGLLVQASRGALFTIDPLTFGDGLVCGHRALAEQMLLTSPPAEPPARVSGVVVRDLAALDASAARALVYLTKTGPFAARTLEIGRYVGAFKNGALIALAGERMRLPGYVEISAICTHPDHRGLGLARILIITLARDALGRGQVPFLHGFTMNTGAIAAYRKMGFTTRKVMHLASITARVPDAF